MHERSLVRSLAAQVAQVVADHGGGGVRGVRVQLGALACVEPLLMISAWEELKLDAGFDEATLEIEDVPLGARCRACSREFEPAGFRFRCPACGSNATEVISGDGVILHSIVLDQASEGATPCGA